MKKTMNVGIALVALTVSGTAAVSHAPIASATGDVDSEFGSEIQLHDGSAVQGWTVNDLRRSVDVIPYPVAGVLWEATATGRAVQGGLTPFVPNFNAHSATGQSYRTLFEVATPQGVNPASLGPGQSTSGKLYFDVVGDSPTEVLYRGGGHNMLRWRQPQAVDTASQSNPQSVPQSPAAVPIPFDSREAARGGGFPAPAFPAPPAPDVWQGTPITEGAPVEPVPAAAVPPSGAEASPQTPSPATTPSSMAGSAASDVEGLAPPMNRLGTPLPEGTAVEEASPGAGAAVPAPPPPAWQGTPLPSSPVPTPPPLIAPPPVG